jgi:hypothetical protein
MRIGFTEAGDGGLDLSWYNPFVAGAVDGVVVVTKNVTGEKTRRALLAANAERPGRVILHAGCTGLGSTWLEPRVPAPDAQLDAVATLVNDGFPLDHVVVRVDPVIPRPDTLACAEYAIQGATNRRLLLPDGYGARLRISVYDEYAHVKRRLADRGYEPFYEGDRFRSNAGENTAVMDMLARAVPRGTAVRTCAEVTLVAQSKDRDDIEMVAQGCLSEEDLSLMGLALPANTGVNPQHRGGCLCLTCKTELLKNRRPCPHGCVYCYWRDR